MILKCVFDMKWWWKIVIYFKDEIKNIWIEKKVFGKNV